MDDFIRFLAGQIEPLLVNLPGRNSQDDNYEITFQCKVTHDTYERELFVAFLKDDGWEKHHTEMIAEGLFSQEAFEKAAIAIEQEIRKLPEYKENGYFEFPLK